MIKRIKDAIQGKAPLSKKRSSAWGKVRKAHLLKHPFCAACSRINKLEVHHIVPFHIDPSLELEPLNLITLCDKGCHMYFGHFGNYRDVNEKLYHDISYFKDRVKEHKAAMGDEN